MRRQMSAWSPGGPTNVARVSENSIRANLRVTSRLGTASVLGGSLDEEGLQALTCARGHEHPVGRQAVGHHRLHAVELVPRAAPGGAYVHAFDRVAVTGFVERDGPALRAGRERLRAGRSRPRARAASVARIADEKNGPGNSARPISSCTTTASTRPSPRPPADSGTSRPVQPSSTILAHTSVVTPTSSCSAILRTYAFGASAARNDRTESRERQLLGREDEVHYLTLMSGSTCGHSEARVTSDEKSAAAVAPQRGSHIHGFRMVARRRRLQRGARGVPRQGDAAVRRAVVRQRGRGGVTRRHGRDGQAQGLAEQAQRRPLGRDPLARGVGRARRDDRAAGDLHAGDGEVPLHRHLQRQRHRADRPVDHLLGHRGSEGALAAGDPRRVGALVPGLLASRRPVPTSPTCARPRSCATTVRTTSSTGRRRGSRRRRSRSGACS